MWRPTISSDELWHHGILGQSWGHRNGPPYPLDAGDHSAKEKKAGYKKSIGGGEVKSNKKKQKDFVKSLQKRHSTLSISEYDNSLVNDIKNNVSKEKLDKFREISKKLRDVSDAEDDFFDSKERYEASAKAYDETYKWFEKNDPDYLNAIIKNNNGNKDTLDQFHDFRKTYEGFEDEAWTLASDKYMKKRGYSENAWNETYDEFQKAQTELVNDILGKYGNKPIRHKGSKRTTTAKQLVGSYLQDAVR